MPALYYVFGLGFGMVGIYIILQAYVPYDKERIANYFARMMVGIGIMGIAMVAWEYIESGHEIAQNFRRFMRHFQFGNNLSNNLLLSMPFAFYLAVKTSKAAPSVFLFCGGSFAIYRHGFEFVKRRNTVQHHSVSVCAFNDIYRSQKTQIEVSYCACRNRHNDAVGVLVLGFALFRKYFGNHGSERGMRQG